MRALIQRRRAISGPASPSQEGSESGPASRLSWIPKSWLFPAQPAPLRKETLPRNMPGWHYSAWGSGGPDPVNAAYTALPLGRRNPLLSACPAQACETVRPPEVCTLLVLTDRRGPLWALTSMVLCSVALNRVPQTQMCKEGGAGSPQPRIPRENSPWPPTLGARDPSTPSLAFREARAGEVDGEFSCDYGAGQACGPPEGRWEWGLCQLRRAFPGTARPYCRSVFLFWGQSRTHCNLLLFHYFYLNTILDLQKSCKDSTKNSHTPFTWIPQM